jgi:AAA15 family ATPase/GTPase
VDKLSLAGGAVIPSELPYLHSPFLTHAAAFDGDGVPATIIDHFRNYVINTGRSNDGIITQFMIHIGDELKRRVIQLMGEFNIKYDDVFIQDEEDSGGEIGFKYVSQDKIVFQRIYKTNDSFVNVNLNLKSNESAGTQKLVDLAGILYLALETKRTTSPIIVIDEIDSNFHPSLLIKLISLFNDPSHNESNAQLLFTSHDTNLMSPEIMRRDQFYFAEKDQNQATRIYSLADLKGIRNDADFAKAYLAGYYGAVPCLHDYVEEK